MMETTELPKFPELVADPTTNEQKIIAWRKDFAEKLYERILQINERYANRNSRLMAKSDLLLEVARVIKG